MWSSRWASAGLELTGDDEVSALSIHGPAGSRAALGSAKPKGVGRRPPIFPQRAAAWTERELVLRAQPASGAAQTIP